MATWIFSKQPKIRRLATGQPCDQLPEVNISIHVVFGIRSRMATTFAKCVFRSKIPQIYPNLSKSVDSFIPHNQETDCSSHGSRILRETHHAVNAICDIQTCNILQHFATFCNDTVQYQVISTQPFWKYHVESLSSSMAPHVEWMLQTAPPIENLARSNKPQMSDLSSRPWRWRKTGTRAPEKIARHHRTSSHTFGILAIVARGWSGWSFWGHGTVHFWKRSTWNGTCFNSNISREAIANTPLPISTYWVVG